MSARRFLRGATGLGHTTGVREGRHRTRLLSLVVLGAASAMVVACGSTRATSSSPTTNADAGIPPGLLAQARPIGRGIKFHPPLEPTGRIVGRCRPGLGSRYGVHVELFAENRVVLIAAGIGTEPPRTITAGRVSRARCYGALVTLDPTGLVLVRPGSHLRLSDLFSSWGEPLSPRELASFPAAPGTVSVFVDGRRREGPPGKVALTRHAEIVLEVGPHVPPHSRYLFPPGT